MMGIRERFFSLFPHLGQCEFGNIKLSILGILCIAIVKKLPTQAPNAMKNIKNTQFIRAMEYLKFSIRLKH
jgi:hypothetical protein